MSRTFYPSRLTLLGRPRAFTMSLHATGIGSVLLGDLSYSADTRIDCGDLTTSYHVNLPLRGRLASRYSGTDVVATPEQAALYGPVGDTVLSRWEAGCRQLCVKIERTALETALSRVLGREIAGPVTLDPVLDVRRGAGRSWAELAVMLNDQLRRPDSIVHQPLVGGSLAAGLITGLIVAAGLERRSRHAEQTPTAKPRAIDRAIEYLHEHAAEPIGTADVAVHCSVGVRTLQEGFARHVGRPPLHYLRSIRLRRAHETLLAANPHEHTVATVAHSWGFTHLGRFAAAHEAEFGEPPSHTLRRGS